MVLKGFAVSRGAFVRVGKWIAVLLLLSGLGACGGGGGGGGDAPDPGNTSIVVPVPQNISVVAGLKQIDVSWDAVAGATGYKLYIDSSFNVTFTTPVMLGATTHYHLDNLDDGTTYYVAVVALIGSDEGALSVVASARTTAIPPAPAYINVTGAGHSMITTWPAATDATSYALYWNTTGGVTTSDNRIDVGDVLQYTHMNLAPGTSYYYRVEAISAAGTGVLSNEDSSVTVPLGPTNLNLVVGSEGVLHLLWDETGSFDDYRIYWNDTGTVSTSDPSLSNAVYSLDNGQSTLAFEDLVPGQTYYFAVSAENNAGEGNLSTTVSATAQGTEWINPTYQGHRLDDVIWTGSQYVAVGNYASVLSSPDGSSWTRHSAGTGTSLQTVAYTGSVYVIGYYDGTLFTSSDLNTWTQRDSGTTQPIHDIVWTGSQLVAVGGNGLVLTSSDGSSWTSQTSNTSETLHTVFWDGSTLMAGGTNSALITSTDGINWTSRSMGTGNAIVYGIAWTGSEYVAVGWPFGFTASSPDGITWTEQTNALISAFESIVWTGTQLIASADYGRMYLSSNGGANWSQVYTPGGFGFGEAYHALNWNGSQAIAVGDGSSIISSSTGSSWVLEDSVTNSQLNAVAYSGVRYVAVGEGNTIITSLDGDNWVDVSAAPMPLNDVIWDGTRFVAVGRSSTVMDSTDGVNWNVQQLPTPMTMNAVAWSGSEYVIVGTLGRVYRSTNLSTWTLHNIGESKYMRDVIWSGSQFVTVGEDYLIYTSTDGTSWQDRTPASPFNRDFNAVVYADNQYIAAGENGEFYLSDNGVNWVDPVGSLGLVNDVQNLLWTGNQYVAVVNDDVSHRGKLVSSLDGEHWYSSNQFGMNGLNEAVWDGSSIIAVGELGTIIRQN